MQKYWNLIEISDIKEIDTGCSGIYDPEGKGNREWFAIKMKNGNKNILHYISQDDKKYAEEARLEIRKLFNEYNNIPEMYLLENEAFAIINGKLVRFGCRVIDNLGQYILFTQKEIDKFEKQFKIKDEGWRHLLAITMLKIEENKIVFPKKVSQRYLEQLEYMGYDVNLLKFEKE